MNDQMNELSRAVGLIRKNVTAGAFNEMSDAQVLEFIDSCRESSARLGELAGNIRKLISNKSKKLDKTSATTQLHN